jgi:ADP-ribose pyrophosphatase YjhB (NUDIX family)
MWGFPAGILEEGELPEKGLKRVAKEKLGKIEIKPIEFVGAISQERKDFILYLMHYKAILKKGQPNLKKGLTKGTKYIDQKWTKDSKDLLAIAKKGSICTQLFLHKIGLWPREKFIYYLEV